MKWFTIFIYFNCVLLLCSSWCLPTTEFLFNLVYFNSVRKYRLCSENNFEHRGTFSSSWSETIKNEPKMTAAISYVCFTWRLWKIWKGLKVTGVLRLTQNLPVKINNLLWKLLHWNNMQMIRILLRKCMYKWIVLHVQVICV